MIIQTKDFTLRPFRLSDAKDLAKNINNKTIARNTLHIPYPYKLLEAKSWLRKVVKQYRQSAADSISLAIEVNGEAVGSIGFHNLTGHKGELGYWLAKKYWGQSLMSKVVKEMVRYGFIELGLSKIVAKTRLFNLASAKVLLKNGFKLEGILQKDHYKEGKYLDSYLFAKIK